MTRLSPLFFGIDWTLACEPGTTRRRRSGRSGGGARGKDSGRVVPRAVEPLAFLAIARAPALVAAPALVLVLGATATAGASERGGANAAALAASARGTPAVAVASSLRAAWPALEARWRERLPAVGARPTFGASHTLARQIARGAPFELFLAADDAALATLAPAGAAAREGAPYAFGRLALLQRGRATAAGARGDAAAFAALAAARAASPPARLAIPHPEHAPYGRAARETLASSGLWPWPAARLARGENAAQTLQFFLAGAVDAALVPLALVALEPPAATRVTPVDPTRHAPLAHRSLPLEGASDAARALARWFAGEEARAVLVAAGFAATGR